MDNCDMLPCDSTATYTDATYKGFIARWSKIKQSKVVELLERLHSGICNVPTHLLPGVRMQIKLTEARRDFFLMNKDAVSKEIFNFLEAQLLVKRVRPNHAYLLAHNTTLLAWGIAKYNLTRV